MIPARLQYFLEHFWNEQKRDQIWTLGPRIHHQNISNDTRNMMGTALENMLSYLTVFNSLFLQFRKMKFGKVKLEVLKFEKFDLFTF